MCAVIAAQLHTCRPNVFVCNHFCADGLSCSLACVMIQMIMWYECKGLPVFTRN